MNVNQLNTRIILRHDSTTAWLDNESVVLFRGEVGIEFFTDGRVKMKIGDGVTSWAQLSYFGGEDTHVLNVIPNKDETHEDAITRITGSIIPVIGDIVVVTTVIDSDKYFGTSYIYNGSAWLAFDGNYTVEYLDTVLKSLEKRVKRIEDVVGDETSGLVFDVARHTENITDILNKVSEVENELSRMAVLAEEKIFALASNLKTVEDSVKTNESDILLLKDHLDDALSEITTLQDTISNDHYTKTETDIKIAEAISQQSHFSAKVVLSINEMTEPGVIYLLQKDNVVGSDIYEEYIVIDGKPVIIGETSTDLSGYATTDVVEKLDYRLVTAEGLLDVHSKEIAALKETVATPNIIESVDTNYFVINETRELSLLDIAIEKVTGLKEALESKLQEDQLTEWLIQNRETVPSLLSTEEKNILDNLKNVEAGAEVNKIIAITIADDQIELPIIDRIVNIPAASIESCGVVRASEEENKVKVLKDHTMEVNSVNVNKLTQTEGEWIVLNGGTSSI